LDGICDFYNWAEADIPTSRGIGYTKEFLTHEVNAAIDGVCSAYPDAEFTVEDGHGGGYFGPNIIAEKLHRQAKLVVGRYGRHMSLIDPSFDGAMIIGAHSMAGTAKGQMNHTISRDRFYNVFLNGVAVGEIGICSAIAGNYGVPMIMVSGDYWAAEEAKQLIPNIKTAAVKKGMNTFCAECLHPDEARALIRQAAYDAAGNPASIEPYLVGGALKVHIDYIYSEQADEGERKGGKRAGNRSVIFEGDDLRRVFNQCFG
jgi:D-amino peptidase